MEITLQNRRILYCLCCCVLRLHFSRGRQRQVLQRRSILWAEFYFNSTEFEHIIAHCSFKPFPQVLLQLLLFMWPSSCETCLPGHMVENAKQCVLAEIFGMWECVYSSGFLLHEVQKQSIYLVTNAIMAEKVLNEDNVKSHRPNTFQNGQLFQKTKVQHTVFLDYRSDKSRS